MYAEGVVSKLRRLGHHVKLLYSTRSKVVSKLGVVLIAEVNHDQKLKSLPPLEPDKRSELVARWRYKNAVELDKQVGLKDGPQFRFLSGILFAPLTSTSTVPLLQKVIQADAAHMCIGKYTLFSAYSASASSNMSPVALGIMFGNEDKENWIQFWKYAVELLL